MIRTTLLFALFLETYLFALLFHCSKCVTLTDASLFTEIMKLTHFINI